jgi:hypothetical protein
MCLKERENYITSKSNCEDNNNFKKLENLQLFIKHVSLERNNKSKGELCFYQSSFCTEITYAEIVLIAMLSTEK